MVYPKQPKVIQFTTIIIEIVCLLFGILCANADYRWNKNVYSADRLALLHKKYKLSKWLNFEEQIIIERALEREYDTQVAALAIWGFMFIVALIHCYLCFLLSYLYYRKNINMYFHLFGCIVILVGTACYTTSFAHNNEQYNRHFEILYEGVPSDRVPWHPCKFPQLESGFIQLFTGRPYACQESWTKIFVIILGIFNTFLHLFMAFVVAFFVEEEDSAEMLYKEMEIVGGGKYPPLSSLDPLPYYARPIADSPITKRHWWTSSGKMNRVEVPLNWTDPKADLSQPLEVKDPLTPTPSRASIKDKSKHSITQQKELQKTQSQVSMR